MFLCLSLAPPETLTVRDQAVSRGGRDADTKSSLKCAYWILLSEHIERRFCKFFAMMFV